MSETDIRHRTSQLAHYIIDNRGAPNLGKTKLFKMMWFADLLHYRRCGETISGQTAYVRMPKGPVPNEIYPILDELADRKVIFNRRVLFPNGHARHELTAIEPANPEPFSSSELHTIQQAIAAVAPLTAERCKSKTNSARRREGRCRQSGRGSAGACRPCL
jgi:hypothetical protein